MGLHPENRQAAANRRFISGIAPNSGCDHQVNGARHISQNAFTKMAVPRRVWIHTSLVLPQTRQTLSNCSKLAAETRNVLVLERESFSLQKKKKRKTFVNSIGFVLIYDEFLIHTKMVTCQLAYSASSYS